MDAETALAALLHEVAHGNTATARKAATALTFEQRQQVHAAAVAVAALTNTRNVCPSCWGKAPALDRGTTVVGRLNDRQNWHTRCYYGPNGGRDK